MFSEIVRKNRRRVPAAEARVEGHSTVEDRQPRNSYRGVCCEFVQQRWPTSIPHLSEPTTTETFLSLSRRQCTASHNPDTDWAEVRRASAARRRSHLHTSILSHLYTQHKAVKDSRLCPQLHCTKVTRHRASTSMYSLTFCDRLLLPERHQRKPAVQAAAVMLRTPPVDGQSPASQPRPLPIYGVHNFEKAPRHAPVGGQQRAQTPPSRPFAVCRHIAGWTQACN